MKDDTYVKVTRLAELMHTSVSGIIEMSIDKFYDSRYDKIRGILK